MIINESFRDLIAPLGALEFAQLEANILVDGIRDPLIVWGNVLIDGHNRYEISQKHGLTFQTTAKDFADEDEAKIWIIRNQLGRRNLKPTQIEHLRGQRYALEKKAYGQNGNQYTKSLNSQNDSLASEKPKSDNTAERIASEYGVSPNTILRDAKVAKAIDAIGGEAKVKILAGQVPIRKKELIKLAIAPKEEIAAVAKEIEDGTYEKSPKVVEVRESEPARDETSSKKRGRPKDEFKEFVDKTISYLERPRNLTECQKVKGDVDNLTSHLKNYLPIIEAGVAKLSEEDRELIGAACDEQYRMFNQFMRRAFNV